MRTTINIDEEALRKIMSITHAATKTQAVVKAVWESIRSRQLKEIKGLTEKIHIRDNWKELEARELKHNE